MTDIETQPSVTKELLETTCKEFPNIPAHMVKMIYDFHKTNPTYLQDNPDIMNKAFTPEAFNEVFEGSVSINKPEDVEPAPPIEGLTMTPITSLSEQEYEEQLEKMKAADRKLEMEEE
tara:strand:- start:80 stop:433 length:354 start_codon:yes stop_codon:yes gene_type:complete